LTRKSRRSAESAAGEDVAERLAEVGVEVGVDARVYARRQVAKPREHGEHAGRNLARTTQSVGEVGAEERQPENDERQEHPDECPLR